MIAKAIKQICNKCIQGELMLYTAVVLNTIISHHAYTANRSAVRVSTRVLRCDALAHHEQRCAGGTRGARRAQGRQGEKNDLRKIRACLRESSPR